MSDAILLVYGLVGFAVAEAFCFWLFVDRGIDADWPRWRQLAGWLLCLATVTAAWPFALLAVACARRAAR